MKRSALFVCSAVLLGAAVAVARDIAKNDLDMAGHTLTGLPSPSGVATAAVRSQDVAPGAGYLQASGANVLPLTAVSSIPGTDVGLTSGAVGYGSPGGRLTGDLTNFRWDSVNLRLGIRQTSPAFQLHLVDQSGASDRGLAIGGYGTTAEPAFIYQRARGTFASPAAMTTADYLGRTIWQAYSGSSYLGTVSMGAHVDPGSTVTSTSVPSTWWLTTGSTGTSAVTDPFAASSTVAISSRGNQVRIGMPVDFGTTGTSLSWQAGNTVYGTTLNSTTPGATYSNIVGRTSITAPTPVAANDLLSTQRWYGYDAASALVPVWHVDVSANTVGTGTIGGEWALHPSFSGSLLNIAALHVESSYNVSLGNLNGNATNATAGFLWLPKMAGPPTGVAAAPTIRYIGHSVAPFQLDTLDKRIYVGVEGTASWEPWGQSTAGMVTGYLQNTTGTGLWSSTATIPIGDVPGAVATSRTVIATAPILIEGDNAAHDLSANRTWSFAFDNSTLTLTGGNALQRGHVTGDVDIPAGSNTATITANAVTDSKLRQGAPHSVMGRSANSLGPVADIPCSADGNVVWQSGTTLGCSMLDYSKLTGTPAAITALTGDVTAAGPGSAAATLATVGGGAGSCTYCSVTFDGKGRQTAYSSGATPEVPLTFSTGLTRATNTITANLSTGISGGQSVVGGTAAGNDLTLQSTTNATKGRILDGTWFALDEVNQRVLVGTQTAGVGPPLTVASAATAGSVALGLTRAGDQGIEKQGSGDLYVGTLGAQLLGLYTNNVTRLLIDSSGGVKLTSLAGTGTRIVSASSTGVLGIATSSDIAASITWPAAGRVLISSGTTTAPTGDANFTYDTATHSAAIGTSLAVNGAAPPSNASLVVGHTSNTDRDRVQFFVGGGSNHDSPDETLVYVNAAASTIPAGRTTGVWATTRIDRWALTGASSPTITEATSLYVANAPSITSATGTAYAIHAPAGAVAFGDLGSGGGSSRLVQADPTTGRLRTTTAPMTMIFAYGGSSYDVALPSGALGHTPDFWMRPSTYSSGGTIEGFAAFQQVWEYPAPDSYTVAELFIRESQCSITSSSGDNDLTYVVTVNGVDTGLSITDGCPGTGGGTVDTSFDDSDSVTVGPGDRVGVRVHVTGAGAYSSGALRSTVTLRLR